MKVATIGSGMIVDWFLHAAAQNDGVEAVAMYSRRKESAAPLAEKYQIQKIYTDLDEMLADKEIDTVYVASPNSLHFPQTKQAMLAGKHVICEKPFTSTLAEAKELKQLALQHQVYLFEAIVTAHMPNYLELKKHIEDLGTIRMVQCNFSQYSSKYNALLAGETPNVFNTKFSGGALADINIYNLHFVAGLFGMPEDIHYFPNKHENGIDTSGVAILTYPGFQAVCVGCKDTKSKCMAQIQGEKGYIIVESETSRCANVTLYKDGNATSFTSEQNPDSLFYEVMEFNRIINANDFESCMKKLDYSLMVMDIYEKARKNGGILFEADK